MGAVQRDECYGGTEDSLLKCMSHTFSERRMTKVSHQLSTHTHTHIYHITVLNRFDFMPIEVYSFRMSVIKHHLAEGTVYLSYSHNSHNIIFRKK